MSMKRIKFFVLIIVFFSLSVFGQLKPKTDTKKIEKKNDTVTTQKARTENGKSVILKSDGTWEYEQPKEVRCDLRLNNAPKIRSLRLGMTKDEVLNVFDDIYDNKSPFFERRSPFLYARPDILRNGVVSYVFYNTYGFDALQMDFFNSDLHQFVVKYSEATVNFTNEQFRLKIIESFNLPDSDWEDSYTTYFFSRGLGKKIECAEFEIEVAGGNILAMTNLITSKKIEESEQRKREVFKP